MDVNDKDSNQDSSEWFTIDLDNIDESLADFTVESIEEELDNEEDESEEDVNDDDSEDQDDEDNDSNDDDDDSDTDEEGQEEEDETSESDKEEEKPRKRRKTANDRIRELVRQRKEAEEEAAKYRKELEESRKASRKTEQETATYQQETLNTQIETYQDQLKDAISNGDAEKQSAITVKLQEAITRKIALDSYVRSQETDDDVDTSKKEGTTPQQKQLSREEQILELPDAAQDWAMDNDWFLSNQVMTNKAIQEVIDMRQEGLDPESDEFYDELDLRMREHFPRRFKDKKDETQVKKDEDKKMEEKKSKKKPTLGTNSSSRGTSNKEGKKRIRLSREDREFAEKMGIPLERYAKEKLKSDKAAEQGMGTFIEVEGAR